MSRPSAPSRSTRRLPLALILGTAALTTLTAASAAGGLFGQRAQVFVGLRVAAHDQGQHFVAEPMHRAIFASVDEVHRT